MTQSNPSASRKPLRLWPGVAFAIILVLSRFIVPAIVPDTAMLGFIGALGSALAIVLWWLLFSRAPWSERIGAIVMMVVAVFVTLPVVHESIRGGMMGMMLPISAFPFMSLGLVAWAVASRRLSTGPRWAALVAAILLSCGVWTLLRTDGITGAGTSQLAWRWTETSEEQLLARAADEPVSPLPAPTVAEPQSDPITVKGDDEPLDVTRGGSAAVPSDPKATKSELAVTATIERPAWPGFRGPDRDGIVHGVRINTEWSTSPPAEMWRRPVGPGWSSFAVRGDLFYTQEQRGDDEIVACYRVSTGEPMWRHRDNVRFWESNGGAGPRATPTLSNGRVYTFGATGILNALDAATGAVVWSRNVAAETKTAVPGWGFSSSPLVVDDVVIVAADATLVAYDIATGKQRWVGPVHVGSYSSPHRTTIDGVVQVLMLGGGAVTSIAPADGTVLWEHSWPGAAIVQPALTTDGDVLINTIGATGGNGIRRLAAARGEGGWTVEERWTSNGLKPYFNDFVLHKGHAFGFDGTILASIDLTDGKRKWKGGRYGSGQLVVLPEQDLLLVLSEEGEIALVSATPDQFKEVARFPAIQGKTWNHPALVGDVLLVRNGEEMAAFRLPVSKP
jgi:outer membrane protein assembly factor BamB